MAGWHLDMNYLVGDVWDTFSAIAAPGSEFHWPYLVCAAALAFILYCLRHGSDRNLRVAAFLGFCFPKRVYAHRSARLDFRFFLVNTVVCGMFIAPMLLTSAGVGNAVIDGLIALHGWPAEPLLSGGLAANLAATVAVVLVADLGFFVAHYLQHRVAFLWEFHKVHHAAEVMYPLTLNRRHPVDMAVDVTLMGVAAGTVLGIFAYLFGAPLEGVTILGTNGVLFLFRCAGAPLRHSHIRVSFGPLLERALISPTLHQVHHSCSPQHIDKNFGGILSVWDRLAGTLYLPRKDEELVLGLVDGEHEDYTSVVGLYVVPFVKNARRLWGQTRTADLRETRGVGDGTAERASSVGFHRSGCRDGTEGHGIRPGRWSIRRSATGWAISSVSGPDGNGAAVVRGAEGWRRHEAVLSLDWDAGAGCERAAGCDSPLTSQ